MLFPEFAPQSGVIITWPHRHSDWRTRLASVEPVYIRLADCVSRYQRLLIICHDDEHRRAIAAWLEQAGTDMSAISFASIKSNDTWIRDYGPLAVSVEGETALLDFSFDGWGGKHAATLDNAVTGELQRAGFFGQHPCHRDAQVLEGGSIDTDGEGTLLTTVQCLHQGRYPHRTRAGLERWLRSRLDITRVCWLAHGTILGDDTDGHVDMLARFCSADTIAHAQCDDPADPHHEPLRAMAAELSRLQTNDGQPYHLVPLPLPAAIHDEDNRRLPASYANFLIINGAVLMPAYNDPADEIVRLRLQTCFPDRDIHAIDCRPLIHQGGSLHCATMQLPAGVMA